MLFWQSLFPAPVRIVREWTTLGNEDDSHPLQIQEIPESQESEGKKRAQKVHYFNPKWNCSSQSGCVLAVLIADLVTVICSDYS